MTFRTILLSILVILSSVGCVHAHNEDEERYIPYVPQEKHTIKYWMKLGYVKGARVCNIRGEDIWDPDERCGKLHLVHQYHNDRVVYCMTDSWNQEIPCEQYILQTKKKGKRK